MKRMLVLVLVLLSVSTGASANESLFRNSQVGAEFSFLGALLVGDSGRPHIAGTLTLAKKHTNWELAFPFFYTQFTFDPEICCEVHIRRVDLQLRRYFKKSRGGPYVGLVARYSDVLGRDYDDNSQRVSFTRAGLGVVFGVRGFVHKNIYLGTNVQFGNFFNDAPPLADGTIDFGLLGPSDYVESRFFNVELFKAGVRF